MGIAGLFRNGQTQCASSDLQTPSMISSSLEIALFLISYSVITTRPQNSQILLIWVCSAIINIHIGIMASPSTITTSTTSAVPALTTTFTPAASCLTDLYLYSVVSGGYLWDYRQLGPSPTASECFPSKFSATPSAYFSPGICPTYYSIACSTVVNIGTVTETRATCCPRYVFSSDNFSSHPC